MFPEEEGVDLSRVVIGHSGDSTDLDYLRQLMDRGSTIGMDRSASMATASRPRGRWTRGSALRAGYVDRMVLSHDTMCHSDRYASVQEHFPTGCSSTSPTTCCQPCRARRRGAADRADARCQPSAVVRAAERLLRLGRGLRGPPSTDGLRWAPLSLGHLTDLRRRRQATRLCRGVGERSHGLRGAVAGRADSTCGRSRPLRRHGPRHDRSTCRRARPHSARQDAGRDRPVVGRASSSSPWDPARRSTTTPGWASTTQNGGGAWTKRSGPSRALWRRDDEPFVGRFYSTEGIDLRPAPARPDGPPIWIGSWGSHAGLRRTTRLGDGWLASAYNTTPDGFCRCVVAAPGLPRRTRQRSGAFPQRTRDDVVLHHGEPLEADEIVRTRLVPTINRPEEVLRERLPVGPADAFAQNRAVSRCRRAASVHLARPRRTTTARAVRGKGPTGADDLTPGDPESARPVVLGAEERA